MSQSRKAVSRSHDVSVENSRMTSGFFFCTDTVELSPHLNVTSSSGVSLEAGKTSFVVFKVLCLSVILQY